MVDVFYDPPEMEQDDRQRVFGKALDKVDEHLENDGFEEVGTISMRGFRAAAVDLGWLQDRIREYWFKYEPDWETAVQEIGEGLGRVVQRLKYLNLNKTKTHIEVEMRTKDDHGYYSYEFALYIEKDVRPNGSPNLRVAEDPDG